MLINLFLLAVGFILLIKSADWLVDHSASLGKKLGISSLIIGLTVVAFGTSAPELVVNVIASIKGSSQIVFGNIVGSNIANIGLVLGLASVMMALNLKSQTLFKEIPLMILGGITLAIVALDSLFNKLNPNIISRADGVILLLLFVIFLYYIILNVVNHKKEKQLEYDSQIKKYSILKSVSFIIISLVGLFFGGQLVVNNAVSLAEILGVSQKLIGLTIVSIGTSLPELITSIVAAFKKQADISIGNIVGSNIFNTTLILGTSAVIRPINLDSSINFDLTIMIGLSLLLLLFSLTKQKIEKWEGLSLLVIYIVYILLLIFRG